MRPAHNENAVAIVVRNRRAMYRDRRRWVVAIA
jgi:hypothetical protein